MYYENIGIAILRPKLFENKLDSFDVELITSIISPDACRKKGGKWIEDATGEGCHFNFSSVIDVSMDDIVWGRLFTEKTAPDEFVKTDEYTVKSKAHPRFQFDCGQDTHDLNVRITHAPPTSPFMKKHYLKYLDMACKHPPKGPGNYVGVLTKSKKGVAGVFYPGMLE